MDVTPTDDSALLHRYAASRDEAAFAELVRRHVDLVYAAAVRRVGDRHMAEDVTQAVFVILAKKPQAAARPAGPLAAWLLTTTRYAAANAMKIERRRQRHERLAAGQTAAAAAGARGGAASGNPSDVLVWQELAAHLDDAILALAVPDRRAVLLRFFERRPVREVAAALDVSEDAAKQRLARALDKLRRKLARRAGTAALAPAGASGALAGMLTAHAVRAAPAALVHSARGAAAASGAGAAATATTSLTIAEGAITMMTWTKIKAVAAGIVVASAVGTGAVVTLNHAMGEPTGGRPAAAAPRAAVAAAPAAAPPPAAPAAAGAAAPGATRAAVRDKARARVQAAEAVVETLAQRQAANDPLTPAFLDLQLAAQRRLAEARIDAADDDDRATRLRAAEEYVKHCQALVGVITTRHQAGVDVTRVEVAQAKYHLADAEYLLERTRAAAQ